MDRTKPPKNSGNAGELSRNDDASHRSQLAARQMQIKPPKIKRQWLRDAAIISLFFSVFLGAVGPFGDYLTIPVLNRVAAWTSIGMSGFLVYASALYLLERFAPAIPWLASQIVTALAGGLILTPIALRLDQMIAGDLSDDLIAGYFVVATIGIVYLTLYEIVRLGRQRTNSEPAGMLSLSETGVDESATPLFLRHLPDHLVGPVICLFKEDHYLRVYTEVGDSLIRFRISDAVSEMENVAGLQTHRSWWVADGAVVRAKRKSSGGGEATLKNGLIVPIARGRVQEAQMAGWFDR